MAVQSLKKIMAGMLGAAMLLAAVACGTTDESTDAKAEAKAGFDVSTVKKDDTIAAMLPKSVADSGELTVGACGTTDESTDAKAEAKAGFDVSTVKKDDTIAAMLPKSVADSGELTVGMELSYAPAEFVGDDGKTPEGYDVDLAKALGKVFGLDTKIISSTFDTIVPSVGTKYDLGITAMTMLGKVFGLDTKIISSTFDTIVPSVGTKYDLGITAMTITQERMDAVDFVSYYKAGSSWAVKKVNPEHIDVKDLCGKKIAVQVGTTQEEEANEGHEDHLVHIRHDCAVGGHQIRSGHHGDDDYAGAHGRRRFC